MTASLTGQIKELRSDIASLIQVKGNSPTRDAPSAPTPTVVDLPSASTTPMNAQPQDSGSALSSFASAMENLGTKLMQHLAETSKEHIASQERVAMHQHSWMEHHMLQTQRERREEFAALVKILGPDHPSARQASPAAVLAHVDPDLNSPLNMAANPMPVPTNWVDPQRYDTVRKSETAAAVSQGLQGVVDNVRNPFARQSSAIDHAYQTSASTTGPAVSASQRFGTGLTAAIYASPAQGASASPRHVDDGYITSIAVPHLSKIVTPYDGGNSKATLSEVAFARYLDGYRRARMQYPGA